MKCWSVTQQADVNAQQLIAQVSVRDLQTEWFWTTDHHLGIESKTFCL